MRKIRQVQDYLLTAKGLFPGMTIARLLVLHEVKVRGEIDQSTLLENCGLKRSCGSKAIASLTELTADKTEGPGLIESTADPMNLKTRIIRLTPKGQEALEMIFRAAWLD